MTYTVYLLTNRSGTLYVGMTNNLERRLVQHRAGAFPEAFTARYALDRLIYVETFGEARDAVQRERQSKGWRRGRRWRL